MLGSRWLRFSLLLVVVVTPGCRRAPAPVEASVTPKSLGEAAPTDRALIATDDWLIGCFRGNPNTLNPILNSSAIDKRVHDLLFDGPFVYDENLEWQTNDLLVESCVDSADHLTTTLRLKKGLRWHDGVPFTAHDIAYTWRKIVDDRVPTKAARTGPDQISACVALDEWTVRYTHKAALPTNKWNIAFDLIPKHIYEKGEADDPTMVKSEYNMRMNRSPVGNGPYRFVEWITDDKIVLQRWDDYPGPKGHFERIIYRIIPDVQGRMVAFERQEIDEIELTPQQFVLESARESFRNAGVKAFAPRWMFYYIVFNQDGSNPFFEDRQVRRAMCYAMNYPLMIKQVFHGLFEQSLGPFRELRARHGFAPEPFRYDLDMAASLLDKAGWLRDAADGWRYRMVDREGTQVRQRFAFTIKIPQQGQTSPKIIAILASDLERIGVEMKTQVVEWATLLGQARAHDFEATLLAFTLGVEPDQGWNLWHSSSYANGRNYGGYASPRVDALFEKGRHEFDHAERMRCYAELSKVVYEDAPYIFLVDAANLWGFNKRLRGIRLTPRGPHLFHPGTREWWVPKGLALHAPTAP